MRPVKTWISLGICPVWSESSLSAWWKLRPIATHWAHGEDSDQTGRMPRLIRVFSGRICHFVSFVMRRLNNCFTFHSMKTIKPPFQHLKPLLRSWINTPTPENENFGTSKNNKDFICYTAKTLWTLDWYHCLFSFFVQATIFLFSVLDSVRKRKRLDQFKTVILE